MAKPDGRPTAGRRKGPAWGDSRLAAALRTQPRPLINPGERLVCLWSPKAACSSILIWHYARLGVLAAAEAHHRWPHRYRLEVLERDPAHQAMLDALGRPGGAAGWTVVRFVRDPFRRAVSMYRHALRNSIMPGPILSWLGRWPLSLFAPPVLERKAGFSFLQFLTVVAAHRPSRLDVHLRPQRHPVERLLPPSVVINADAEDLYAAINRLEDGLGLARTDFAGLGWLHRMAERHHARPQPAAVGSMAATPLTPAAVARGWPSAEAFRTPDSEALVRRIYAEDYAAYGPAASSPPRGGLR